MAPINAGTPRPATVATARITAAPGIVSQFGSRRSRMSYTLSTASQASTQAPATPAPMYRG